MNETNKTMPLVIGGVVVVIIALVLFMGTGNSNRLFSSTKKNKTEKSIGVRVKKFFYELVDMVIKNKETQLGFAGGAIAGGVFASFFPAPINIIALTASAFIADIPSAQEKKKNEYRNSDMSNAIFYGSFSSILIITMVKHQLWKLLWPGNWFKKTRTFF